MGIEEMNEAKQKLSALGIPEAILTHQKLNDDKNNAIWALAAKKLADITSPSLIPKTLVNFLAAFGTLEAIIDVEYAGEMNRVALTNFSNAIDSQGHSPAYWAFSFSNTSLIKSLEDHNINPDFKDRPEVKQVMQAIKDKNHDALAQALIGMPTWLLDYAIGIEVPNAHTVFIWAAQFLKSHDFQSLIQKCSAEALNDALVKQVQDGWTALHIAAGYQDATGLTAFLEKCSAEALNDALVKQAQYRRTALHIAACYQDATGLTAFLEKCSAEALNDALIKQTALGRTALHIAARNQDAAGLTAFLEEFSPDALAQALVLKDTEGYTALAQMMKHKDEAMLYRVASKALQSTAHKEAIIALIISDAEIRGRFVSGMIASRKEDCRYDINSDELQIVNAGIGYIPGYNPAKTAWEAYKASRDGHSSGTDHMLTFGSYFKTESNIHDPCEIVPLTGETRRVKQD